jgi:hypothetical protein
LVVSDYREIPGMVKINARLRIHHEKELAFERGRLLNLIDSKIRREELEAAKGFAEELFTTEIRFALLKKTRKVARYSGLLLTIMLVLLSVVFICTVSMVLNIRPAFSLVVGAFSVLGIISALVLNSLLMKGFEKTVRALIEVCETRKQFFVERMLECGMKCRSTEDYWQRLSVITAVE